MHLLWPLRYNEFISKWLYICTIVCVCLRLSDCECVHAIVCMCVRICVWIYVFVYHVDPYFRNMPNLMQIHFSWSTNLFNSKDPPDLMCSDCFAVVAFSKPTKQFMFYSLRFWSSRNQNNPSHTPLIRSMSTTTATNILFVVHFLPYLACETEIPR